MLLTRSRRRRARAERTQVTLTLSADGSFVLDVANDPMWLLLRLETFAGGRCPPNSRAAAARCASRATDVGLRRSHRAVRRWPRSAGRRASNTCRRRIRASGMRSAAARDVSAARHDAARRDAAALALRPGRRSVSARDPAAGRLVDDRMDRRHELERRDRSVAERSRGRRGWRSCGSTCGSATRTSCRRGSITSCSCSASSC